MPAHTKTKLKLVETREDLVGPSSCLGEELSNFEKYVQSARSGIAAVKQYVAEMGWDRNTTEKVLISLINRGYSDVEVIELEKDTVESAFIKLVNAGIPKHNEERQKLPIDIQDKAKRLHEYVRHKNGIKDLEHSNLYEIIYPGALSELAYNGKRILVVGPDSSYRELWIDFVEHSILGKVVRFDSHY